MFSMDTSAYVGMWHRYYPPDNFQSLWSNIEDFVGESKIIASKSVLTELQKQDDAVTDWAKDRMDMFLEDCEETQSIVTSIYEGWPEEYSVDWSKRLLGADLFVIARARLLGFTVVTDEKKSNNMNTPKIPDACEFLQVECLTPLGFIQKCGWVF